MEKPNFGHFFQRQSFFYKNEVGAVFDKKREKRAATCLCYYFVLTLVRCNQFSIFKRLEWNTKLETEILNYILAQKYIQQCISYILLSMGLWGSGGGSVGRAVPSDTRDPQLKSQHQQNFIYRLHIFKKDDKNKEKEAWNGPSLKKVLASPKVSH